MSQNMAYRGGRLAKDVQHLRRHVEAQTQGQVSVVDLDDTSLQFLMVHIMPNEGLYKGARIRFKLRFDVQEYPDHPPVVFCCDRIYHPNIDVTESNDYFTNICVSLLTEWNSAMDLDHIIQAILFLMHHPAFDDALSPYFDGDELGDVNAMEIKENIRRSLTGETVDGWEFDNILFPADSNNSTVCIEHVHNVDGFPAELAVALDMYTDQSTDNNDILSNGTTSEESLVPNAPGFENVCVINSKDIASHPTKCWQLDFSTLLPEGHSVDVDSNNSYMPLSVSAIQNHSSNCYQSSLIDSALNSSSASRNSQNPSLSKPRPCIQSMNYHNTFNSRHKVLPFCFKFLFSGLFECTKKGRPTFEEHYGTARTSEHYGTARTSGHYGTTRTSDVGHDRKFPKWTVDLHEVRDNEVD